MKDKLNYIVTTTLLIISFFSCQNGPKGKIATIECVKQKNIGKIKHIDTINIFFKIKNTSNVDLKIKDIKSGCGCTVVNLKDSIILPNKTRKIEISFVPKKEMEGLFEKSIVIDANTNPNFTVLYIKGEVVN